MKHVTRPVTLKAVGKCPRCKSTSFEGILKKKRVMLKDKKTNRRPDGGIFDV
jgi:hypothetical protein